jgi:hypothetical protein
MEVWMGSYDSRRTTLDPGLTALALRGLQKRRERYPFMERHIRRRTVIQAVRRALADSFPTFRALLTVRRDAG